MPKQIDNRVFSPKQRKAVLTPEQSAQFDTFAAGSDWDYERGRQFAIYTLHEFPDLRLYVRGKSDRARLNPDAIRRYEIFWFLGYGV